MQKVDPIYPQATWIVLDANTGQNGVLQAREFLKSLGLTGAVLTKMDGTAKGGVVFAVKKELGIPILFLGVGEKEQDLVPFCATKFVDQILESTTATT
jgi:fused signal recognition particle receptor